MKKVYKYKRIPTRTEYIVFKTISNILILSGILFIVVAFGPVISDEVGYAWMKLKSQTYVLADSVRDSNATSTSSTETISSKASIFSKLISTKPIEIEPVDKDFSIVIEKIGVNAPVVRDVSVTNPDAYNEALKNGIAHASLSNYPSEDAGNTYLFAHASVNFWQLGKYATIFNLLRKVELGDRVNIFYEDTEYVYEVVNKEILEGWNTYPLTRSVIEPTLTIQTCDPPGTTLNRLVVTSKLIEVR